MTKILYVTPSIRHSGPINQLMYLISNLDRTRFQPHILCLSPFTDNKLVTSFRALGVEIESLELSRWASSLEAVKRFKQFQDQFCFEIIHTQGFRADNLLSSFAASIHWVATSRNYPYEDYPMKFGRILGFLMACQHVRAFKKCKNIISCSNAISASLNRHSLKSKTIHNGAPTPIEFTATRANNKSSNPVFISVGGLIKRKNMDLLVDAFLIYNREHDGRLIILGDGPEREKLSSKANASDANIMFLGEVSDVRKYLRKSNYFVSASLSEGLPNTVLEALSEGIPCILSDISAHTEIASLANGACQTFDVNSSAASLAMNLSTAQSRFSQIQSKIARKTAKVHFSAESMSQKYQDLYQSIIEGEDAK